MVHPSEVLPVPDLALPRSSVVNRRGLRGALRYDPEGQSQLGWRRGRDSRRDITARRDATLDHPARLLGVGLQAVPAGRARERLGHVKLKESFQCKPDAHLSDLTAVGVQKGHF